MQTGSLVPVIGCSVTGWPPVAYLSPNRAYLFFPAIIFSVHCFVASANHEMVSFLPALNE
jgi:hypothetical protein